MSGTFSSGARVFPDTRWSVVLAARQDSQDSAQALASLCQDYWCPLYAFVRRRGHSPHDAADLVQAFFCRLLEKQWLATADPHRGRLRSFLVHALQQFLLNEARAQRRLMRGGAVQTLSFDTDFGESRLAADPKTQSPEEAFDHQWALSLLDLALGRLQAESLAEGKETGFDSLKATLLAPRGEINYTDLAENLCLSSAAARVAVHRFRKRFRAIFREELLRTLAEGEDVEDELRHLAVVLARK